MNRLVAVVVALALWCGSAWASGVVTWAFDNPGGGGAFTCADSSGVYNLVGTDVGGLFFRNGDSGDWTPIGKDDGLPLSHVYSVKYNKHGAAVAGTADGVFYSTSSSHGQSWTRSTCNSCPDSAEAGGTTPIDYNDLLGQKVTAVGINYDSGDDDQAFVIAWVDNWRSASDADTVRFAISTDDGANFQYVGGIPDGSAGAYIRVPIKIVMDPTTANTSATWYVWCLMGLDNVNDAGERSVWINTDLGVASPYNSSGNWVSLKSRNDINVTSLPVDICPVTSLNNKWLISYQNASAPTDQGAVFVYDYTGNKFYRQGVTGGDFFDKNVSGAAWSAATSSSGKYAWIVSTTDPTSSRAGLWRSPITNDYPDSTHTNSSGWSRVSDAENWERGWADKGHARGKGIGPNVANAISNGMKFWSSASYCWRLSVSDPWKYVGESTTGESAPWLGRTLDNSECQVIAVYGDSTFAGYYDIGLWQKVSSNGWSDWNPRSNPDWTDGDNLGGNVNGIAFTSTNIYVTEAKSSKDEDNNKQWQVWQRAASGAGTWTQKSSFGNGTYLDGLNADDSGLLWASYSNANGASADSIGVLKRSTNNGVDWSNSGLANGTVIMTSRSAGLTILAGGPDGIWRRNGTGAWSHVKTFSYANPKVPNLHKRTWAGVHDIRQGTDGKWWATVYSTDDEDGGLYYSTDDGQTWTSESRAEYRYAQNVWPDSGGARVFITYSSDMSGPIDNAAEMLSPGVLELIPAASSGHDVANLTIGDAKFRRPVAGPIVTQQVPHQGTDNICVVGSGYGVLSGQIPNTWVDTCPDPPCGTERAGSKATRPHEEAEPAKIGRREYTVAEARALVQAGQLELYDVSGRRSREPRAGLFFSIERNKAGAVTARHLVLVRR
jgi:hypothetical protein